MKEQVLVHYTNANIRTIPHTKISEKIENFYLEYQRLQWTSKSRKTCEGKTDFLRKMNETFCFWPRSLIKQMEAEKKCKCDAEKQALEEDIKFLKSMQGDRKAAYVGRDTIYEKVTKRRDDRNKRKREEEELFERKKVPRLEDLIEEPGQQEFTVPSGPKREHRRTKTGTTITIPYDVLQDPEFVSVYVRNGVTPTSIAAILHSLISLGGGDPNCVNLSHSTAHR